MCLFYPKLGAIANLCCDSLLCMCLFYPKLRAIIANLCLIYCLSEGEYLSLYENTFEKQTQSSHSNLAQHYHKQKTVLCEAYKVECYFVIALEQQQQQ